MKTRWLLLPLLLALVVGSAPAQSIQPDIQLQQALSKIVFAHQVWVINDVAFKSINRETSAQVQQALASEALQLSASNITSGSIASIAHRNLVDLITWLPNLRTLDVMQNAGQISDDKGVLGTEYTAQVTWGGGGTLKAPLQPATTFEDAVAANPQLASCTSYVNATIAATFKGESAQWKALYFLGCNNGPEALDLVMRHAVARFWNVDVYPISLMRPDGIRGRNPAVQEWLGAHGSTTCSGERCCYENDTIVVPKSKIPPSLPTSITTTGSTKPPNTTDGLSCSDYGSYTISPIQPRSTDDHLTGSYHQSNDVVSKSCQYWVKATLPTSRGHAFPRRT
jgi:hypothetical protein